MNESSRLEFKERYSPTFLKTVCAFANYDGGKIVFGITDSAKIVGVEDLDKTALRIENAITDNVSPQPDYQIVLDEKNGTVTIAVNPGAHPPYFYKSKTYRRSGVSTVEVDSWELRRLIMKGEKINFESLPSANQELTFNVLSAALTEAAGLQTFDTDTLKTLELLSLDGKFNNAAALLSDKNDFFGIDIARFGESINIIRERKTFAGVSVIEQYKSALEMYRSNYIYEVIDGTFRKTVEQVPEEAFREAVVNAIVHRVYDVDAHIRISMYDDRIEICSPGGLPSGVDVEAYINGYVSFLRNPIFGNVFYRLHLIERFGTGIARIKESYKDKPLQPKFNVTESSIQVVLPLMVAKANLVGDEVKVYEALSDKIGFSSVQVSELCGFGKTKTVKIINELIAKEYARAEGEARARLYFRA